MKLVSPLSPSGFTFLMSSAAIRMFFLLFSLFGWQVPVSPPSTSHIQRLSKSQRLRHLKAKAKGAEDAEEHACTGFNAAILYARDI